jgi:hypothetical protein
VVALVLDHPRVEGVGLQGERLALAVERLQPHVLPARDQAAEIGDGQAALPTVHRLLADRRDHGVDEDGEGDRIAPFVRARHLEHGQTQALVHLGSGQTDPVVLVHGPAHVVDETLDLRGADLLRGEVARRRAHDGMADAGDLQDGHGPLDELSLTRG